jgi:hypothetical protein
MLVDGCPKMVKKCSENRCPMQGGDEEAVRLCHVVYVYFL